MSNARCHSSSVSAAKPPPGADEPPTLLTMMSTPPNRSLTCDATILIPAAVLRSAGMKRAALVFDAALRAVATTVAPALANRSTMAAPIPGFRL